MNRDMLRALAELVGGADGLKAMDDHENTAELVGNKVDEIIVPLVEPATTLPVLSGIAQALSSAYARAVVMIEKANNEDPDKMEMVAVKSLRAKMETVRKFYKDNALDTDAGRRAYLAERGLAEDRRLAGIDQQVVEASDDVLTIITDAAKRGGDSKETGQ